MSNQLLAATTLNLVDDSVRCEMIATGRDFQALEADFRSLYGRCSRATIYESWEWLSNWWALFGGSFTRLRVLTFRKGEKIIGCAPFVVRRVGGLPLRRLEPMGVLRSDTMDLLIEDGCEAEVLAALESYLRKSRDWDLIDLQQLPEDSPTLAYFRERQPEIGCVIREQEVCPYAPLPATWEEFLAGLGKKNRYNVGYYRRLLERDFKVNIRRVEREELDSSLEELFRLHQLRWRKRRLPGALFSSKVREFHRKAASALLESGSLDLYRMDLNGRAVALLHCFAQNGRGYYYLGGFDPEFARYSVGTVLTAFAIQESIRRGHTVFDFLRGDEPYKYRWNVKERRNYRVEWRRPGSVRSKLLYGLNGVTRAIEHKAKEIARKMER